jgi:hypothetical protein
MTKVFLKTSLAYIDLHIFKYVTPTLCLSLLSSKIHITLVFPLRAGQMYKEGTCL